MLEQPSIVETEEQLTAHIHLTVPRSEIQNVMGPGIMEIMSTVAGQGVEITGPWFTHHLRMDPEIFDFEICVPVASPVAEAGRVRPGVLRAARVARATMHGGYEGLGKAWGELDAWVAANGHTPAGDLWECYVKGPESGPDPTTWRTELNRPIEE